MASRCDRLPCLSLLEGPPGATAFFTSVTWQTTSEDAGRAETFRVRARYPEGCSTPEQAWTVTVE